MAILRKKNRQEGRRRLQTDGQPSARQVFSYTRTGSSRQDDTRPAAPKKTGISARQFWLQRIGLATMATVILICLVNVLSLSPQAKLSPLQSSGETGGTFLRDPSTYQAAADKLLAGSIWNRSKITIDTSQLDREMMRQFPELSDVSITLPLLAHRPVVYLQAAQPALVLAADNGSFVIDNRGKALLPADGSAGQSKLPQVVDQSGLKIALNNQVLSSSDVNFIRTVVAQLGARGVTVSSLVLPAGTSELDARIAGQTHFVKFNLHEDNPRQQAGTYLATMAYLQRKNTKPAKYIDVRVPGRAYYQ